jgi:hypothetical protein
LEPTGALFLDHHQLQAKNSGLGNQQADTPKKYDEATIVDVKDSTGESSGKDTAISDDRVSGPDFDSIANNEAFKWLLSRLDRVIQCGSSAVGLKEIEKSIESYFSIIGFHNDAPCQATFEVNCSLVAFWYHQLKGGGHEQKTFKTHYDHRNMLRCSGHDMWAVSRSDMACDRTSSHEAFGCRFYGTCQCQTLM